MPQSKQAKINRRTKREGVKRNPDHKAANDTPAKVQEKPLSDWSKAYRKVAGQVKAGL